MVNKTKKGDQSMIYVVRHGQTDWNLQGRCQGWHDIELNQTGLEQAMELAAKLSDVKFDVCFSSPLKRAVKTAQTIYRGKIILDQRIIERGNGALEGRPDWKDLGVNFNDPNDPIGKKYGVEMLPDLQKRLSLFWDEILEKYVNKNVLVVTHAGTAMWSKVYFYGEPKDGDMSHYHLANCEVWQIDNSKPLKVEH